MRFLLSEHVSMSKNRSFLFQRAIYIFIFGAFLFVSVFFGHRYVLSEVSETEAQTVGVSERLPLRCVELTVSAFDAEVYYRPIVEYNLLRPLG